MNQIDIDIEKNDIIEIYIPCYNSIFCVENQIKTLAKFCMDKHKLIILDSNCGEHPDVSKKIKQICDANNTELIILPDYLPRNINKNDISKILGTKLNYIFYNIIKIRKPKYFGFLDQDFFAYRPFSVKQHLDEFNMYGDVMEHDQYKSTDINNLTDGLFVLHPWLSFYKFAFVENENMNWLPCANFDTGGCNSDIIAKKQCIKKNYWIRDNSRNINIISDNTNNEPFFIYNNKKCYAMVQFYNNTFIHMINSSILDDALHPKTMWCHGFLYSILNL